MKVARIYVRVSTQEQAIEGYSISAQKEKLTNYCKAKDYIIGDIYIDGGFSGANMDRPGLQKLLYDIETKETDIVLVYKLDRLSRSQKDTLHLIEDVFLKKDISFVSIQESFDTSTPFGRAMVGILSVFAQLERENIRERITIGRVERAKEGYWVGQGRPPIGYDYKDNMLVINEYEAMQVKLIFDLYIKGWGQERIRRHLDKKGYTTKYGSWLKSSVHTVYRIIKNKVYIGYVKFDGEFYEGKHESIIEDNTFKTANELYKKRKGQRRETKYFLSGSLKCKQCGANYIINTKNGTAYHMCKNRKDAWKQDFKCNNKIWRVDIIEPKVISKIKNMVKNKDKIIEEKFNKLNKPVESNKKPIKKRINDIEKQINKLMDLYQLDELPLEVIGERIKKLHGEKNALENELKATKEQKEDAEIELQEILEYLNDFDLIWNELSVQEKKDVCKSLFETIYVDEEQLYYKVRG